jgi:hypothetical protein
VRTVNVVLPIFALAWAGEGDVADLLQFTVKRRLA